MTMTTTISPDRLAQLEQIHLDNGGHRSFDDGHCAMEVVAWLAGQGHTDAPSCASPVLRRYTIALNDRWNDEKRQTLKPYLPRMVGTANDGKDAARERIAAEFVAKDLMPPWLRLAGLDEDAEALEALGPNSSPSDLRKVLYVARDRAWAKRREARTELEARIRTHLAKTHPAEAAVAAVATSAAVEAAVVVAAAAAVVAAAAVAEAAAVEVAAMAAVEAAVAVAAAFPDDPWGAGYRAAKKIWAKWFADSDAAAPIRDLAEQQKDVALVLLERLIDGQ